MLSAPADFPHPGSTAFLAPDGDEVRIIQHRGSDQALVGLVPTRANPFAHREASGSRTVARERIFATIEEATKPVAKRRRKTKGRRK